MSIVIPIESNKLSINELNLILDEKEDNPNLQEVYLDIKNDITKLDIVFIAGLFLIHKEYSIIFSMDISKVKLEWEKDNPKKGKAKLIQYLAQIEHLTDVKFNYYLKIIDERDDEKKPIYLGGLAKDKNLYSTSFAPVLFINEENFKGLFIDSLESKITDNLIQKYYTKVLEKLNVNDKVLKDYKKGNGLPEKFQISNVQDKTLIDNYIKKIIKIIDDIHLHSQVHLFVYEILIQKESAFNRITGANIKETPNFFTSLWAFTKEYVKGLKELAKNIIQHTESERGIITISAFSANYALETHVIDLNKKGIISTLRDKTSELNSDKNKDFLSADLTMLKSSYTVSDFLEPTPPKKLNQQLKRDIAHLGLLVFKKLVENNNGKIYLSSNSINSGKRDKYPKNGEKNQLLNCGTHFFFNLSFDENKFKPLKPVETLRTEQQATGETIGGLSRIIYFKLLNEKTDNSKPSEIILLNYEIEEDIKDRDDEDKLFEKIKTKIDSSNTSFFSVNLNFKKIEASSLFRFIAFIAMTDVNKNYILYNVDYDKYLDVLSQNETYFEVFKDNDIPYWNESKGILVYSYKSKNEIPYNFADILFGKTEEDFLGINRIINHTFPNLITIANEENEISLKEIPTGITEFFHQQALLPFDIILPQNNENSLFDNNLKVALTKDLKGEEDA